MMASATAFRFTLTAAHGVIYRVHNHPADMRTPALPTGPSRLAARYVHVIDVADLPDCRETRFVDPANFARRESHQRVTSFAVADGGLLSGAARDLTAAAWSDLNVMNT